MGEPLPAWAPRPGDPSMADLLFPSVGPCGQCSASVAPWRALTACGALLCAVCAADPRNARMFDPVAAP